MSDGTVEAHTARLVESINKGWTNVDALLKGELRTLGCGLGIATMRAEDGYEYKLDGETICWPGKRMTRANVSKLREAVRLKLAEVTS